MNVEAIDATEELVIEKRKKYRSVAHMVLWKTRGRDTARSDTCVRGRVERRVEARDEQLKTLVASHEREVRRLSFLVPLTCLSLRLRIGPPTRVVATRWR